MPDEHKCSNCLKNTSLDIRKQAKSHTSSSPQCPLLIREQEKVMLKTKIFKKLVKNSKSLKFLSFNCCSIRSKVPQICDFLTNQNIDIALLQETWLKKSDSAIVAEMLDYNINTIQVRKSRIFDLGGGVAILSKNELKLNLVKTEIFALFEHTICSISTNLGRLNITTVYYSSYSNEHKYCKSQFLSDFDDFLNSCANQIHLVAGDFNIHFEDKNKKLKNCYISWTKIVLHNLLRVLLILQVAPLT